MAIIRKAIPTVSTEITVEVKAPENAISDLAANIKKVAAKASPEDWAALAKLVDNPAKLAMARNFM